MRLDQDQKQIKREKNPYESANALYEGQELTLNAFKSRIFPLKSTQGKGHTLKILVQKQMLTSGYCAGTSR